VFKIHPGEKSCYFVFSQVVSGWACFSLNCDGGDTLRRGTWFLLREGTML